MPEFRKDPIVNRWVIIAPERARRPQNGRTDRVMAPAAPCAFCAGNEAMTPPEVVAYPFSAPENSLSRWSIRVIPNKYPALIDASTDIIEGDDDGLYQRHTPLGLHEVIVEAPEHLTDIVQLSEQRFAAVTHAYRERMGALRRDNQWRYLLIYKNQGAQAGATFEHVHSQLIALQMVPPELENRIREARLYYGSKGSCVYCDIVRQETRESTRVISETDGFVVFAPFAARFPYETWIVPKRHSSNFEEASKDETFDLAVSLRQTLIRLNRALQNPPFNYIVHSNPLAGQPNGYYHWHIEILPKLVQVAGFEWGSGLFINPVAPEEAARLLRETP